MTQPLISVIVPCYNVEEYLPQCIESILNQTYRNLEILLVDDGSPDNCGKICDAYAGRDSRISVIHKENGGLSDARNVALDVMKGEYVTFVDSDDYVAKDYVESMYEQALETNADIVVTNWVFFNEGEKPIVRSHYNVRKKIFTSEEALVTMMYQRDFDTAACLKLYRSDLFKNQRFPVGYISEDLATVYLLIMKCAIIAWNDYLCYYYLLRKSSIEGVGFNLRKYDSYLKIIAQFERDKYVMTKAVVKAMNCRVVSLLFHLIIRMPEEELDRTEVLWELLKKYRMGVLTDIKARNKAKIALLLSFGGIDCVKGLSKLGSYR